MKYDADKEVIFNDAGHVIADHVPERVGPVLVRSQVFHDRLVEALADLLETEECVCHKAETKPCSVCRYRKLLVRIQQWPMKAAKLAVLLLVVLAIGCRKHEDGTPVGQGTMPGQGSTVITAYAGTVDAMTGCGASCYQAIPVNADVIDYPADAVQVYLCKNAVCAVKALPVLTCAQGVAPAASCYTGMPSVAIVLGKNLVRLVNASQAGYGTYAIQTIVTR